MTIQPTTNTIRIRMRRSIMAIKRGKRCIFPRMGWFSITRILMRARLSEVRSAPDEPRCDESADVKSELSDVECVMYLVRLPSDQISAEFSQIWSLGHRTKYI